MALPLVPIAAAALGAGGLGGILGGLFGGGKESQVTPTTTTTTHTETNQITNQYQMTVDSSYNVVYDSPFGSIKKGAVSQQATPELDVTPTIRTETPIDLNQSSETDSTGLIILAVCAVAGIAIIKEVF